MAYMITHSLLRAWLRSISENPYDDATQEDSSKEEFLRVLRREPTPTNEYKQNGIVFENMVTALTKGQPTDPKNAAWLEAAQKVADIVRGGQLQYAAKQYVQAFGTEIMSAGNTTTARSTPCTCSWCRRPWTSRTW